MSTVSSHSVEVLPDATIGVPTVTSERTPYSTSFETERAAWTGGIRSTTEAYSGAYSLSFKPSTDTVQGTFPDAGTGTTEYTVEFWVRANRNGDGVSAWVQRIGLEPTTATPVLFVQPTLTWQRIKLVITLTTAAGVYLRFKNTTAAASTIVYVDDVTVTARSISLIDKRVTITPSEFNATLDEGWSPYVQATLTGPLPTEDELAQLDPRKNVRVQVNLREDFGASDLVSTFTAAHFGQTAADLTSAFQGKTAATLTGLHFKPYRDTQVLLPRSTSLFLTLRSRRIDWAAGKATYTLASDEALLQDYALVQTDALYPQGGTVASAVRFALATIGAYLGTPEADSDVADDEALRWEPGTSAWDYLMPILQDAGLRLFCDETRRWRLVPATYNRPEAVNLTITSNITGLTDSISRDSSEVSDAWYDSVVAIYKWRDEFDVEHTNYTTAQTPGIVAPTKTLTVTYEGVGNAGIGAQLLLNRAQARGRQVTVEAMSNYTLRPGMTATLGLPETYTQTSRVASVTWNLPADEMTVTTRNVERD